MKNYQSVQHDDDNESNEVISLIDRPTSTPKRTKSYKYFAIVCVAALVSFVAYSYNGTIQSKESENALVDAEFNNGFCFNKDDEYCGPGGHCCKTIGSCQECCVNADCVAKIGQPPAGEFGKFICVENKCQAYANGESSQIPSYGYPNWLPSETLDDSKKYRLLNLTRTVYNDGPLQEQVMHFDFNEQEDSFDKSKIVYNGTHITIPTYSNLHAGYSRSFNHYDEHESGIVTMVMADNKFSVIADYPKIGFVEKYHTLTYDGIKDTSRGDYIKEKAKEQLATRPKFHRKKWVKRNYWMTFWANSKKTIQRQVETGVDKALAWQIRRYVNSYPEDDFGSVNPSTSESWASHSEKAQQAIMNAKDPNFERDYKKSELHCKHFEQLEGVSHTEDTATFPLDRPITVFSGESVFAPVYYLGLAVGHGTYHYDPSTNTLEMFMQTFSHSRQHPDAKFPGPYPSGLWVAPVADGSDYVVDPNRDGRGDSLYITEGPGPDKLAKPGETDFTLWARPTEEVCSDKYMNGKYSDFWGDVDIEKGVLQKNNLWDFLEQKADTLTGLVGGMPCAKYWMRNDYGGGNNFGIGEIGVWGHTIGEIRADKTKEMALASFWDSWECFYGGKNCEEYE